MKKFLFAVISFAAFFIMAVDVMSYESGISPTTGEGEGYRESYNNEDNMTLARNIAARTSATRVAVIGDKKGVLIGIGVKSGTGGRSALRETAEEMAKKYYPKAKIIVEIQTETAEKIFNLASYMEKGIPDEILKSRITYLLENN